jgi:hypothetical protein
VATQVPFTQLSLGQAALPSEQSWHGAPIPGQSESVLHVVPGVTVGQQLQLHGGHVWPAGHAAQAQPQPPPIKPPSEEPFICMQVPDGQDAELHAMPSAAHPQASAVSATQLAESV